MRSSRTAISENHGSLIQQELYTIFHYKAYMRWRVLWENSSGHIKEHITSFSLLSITFESSCLHKLQVNKQISTQSLVPTKTLTSSWAYKKCKVHILWSSSCPNVIVLLIFFYRRILMAHSMWFHLKDFCTSFFMVSVQLSSVWVMLDKNFFICIICKIHQPQKGQSLSQKFDKMGRVSL